MKLKDKFFSDEVQGKLASKVVLQSAIDAAQAAGNHALCNINRRDKVHKLSKHDVKLQLDIECQKIASGRIKDNFPDSVILGEEDNERRNLSNKDSFWIIDPIDGTVNFSHGIPFWCCSVAYVEKGVIVAGAVYAPALNLLYTATIDSEAKCNLEQISVSKTDNLKKSIVLTGLARQEEEWGGNFKRLKALATKTQKVRILGSAALDICFVASGLADCYFESYVYLWDVAAAGLILKQAGGKCKILKYNTRTHQISFLATNSNIYTDFLKLVKT